jgi:hypothetical protein
MPLLAAAALVFLLLSQGRSVPTQSLPNGRPNVATLPGPAGATEARVADAYGKLPLSFEANQGQADTKVKYITRGSGYTLSLTPTGAVLSLDMPASMDGRPAETVPAKGAVLRMGLVGANPDSQIAGTDELPGKVNYLVGNDPARWHTDVPTYAKVHYMGVYPGVDMVYYGNQGQIEYDFVVAPGADPSSIQLAFEGADGIRVDSKGDLVLVVSGGQVRQHKPVVFQMVGGDRREVLGRYVLRGKGQIGFELGQYDRSKPLVIDPVLSYSTFLGTERYDVANSIAVDGSGNAYVVGSTPSSSLPVTSSAYDTSHNGGDDVFVTKLDPTGSKLLYSTYLGGGGVDSGADIGVDASGNAYLTGATRSADFPSTPGAYDTSHNGGDDVFVTKLNAIGSNLIYSTFVGGNGEESASAIALDSLGRAYLTGGASSTGFPTTPGAYDVTFNGGGPDAFVARLSAAGSSLLYSTYLGGRGSDFAGEIDADASGNAYVTGSTDSGDFPTTPGTFDPTTGGESDAFVTKLAPDGSALRYSTYLGGVSPESGDGIVVDRYGSAYIGGRTTSPNFPTTKGAHDRSPNDHGDAFVTKLDGQGTRLVYSTVLGGEDGDSARDIAVDPAGNAYLTGLTWSEDFPTTPEAHDRTLGCCGWPDAFVSKLDATGSLLLYSTFLGGDDDAAGVGRDIGNAVAVDGSGNVYVAGWTQTSDFPTTRGAYDRSHNGDIDAFIVKFARDAVPPVATPPAQRLAPGSQLTRTAIPVGIRWSGADSRGPIAGYRLQQSRDNAAFADIALPDLRATSLTRNLLPGHNYRYRVRAQDADGNWSAWAYGPRFMVTARQENSTAITYTDIMPDQQGGTSNVWRRAAQSSAYGGYVKWVDTKGAKASIGFNGRNVGVAMPMRASLGVARICLDPGTIRESCGTIDLSPSNTDLHKPRKLVWVRNGLDLSIRHQVVITVVSGRVDLDAIVLLR